MLSQVFAFMHAKRANRNFAFNLTKPLSTHQQRRLDVVFQSCMAELKANDIIYFFPFGICVIFGKLHHGHFNLLLCINIDNINDSSRT